MKRSVLVVASLGVTLLCGIPSARAEQWPTLDTYVDGCVLVVKARTVVEKDGALSFQVLESWKGKYDPKNFDRTTPDGRFFANEGEHGLVGVARGQEVIFFFTARNQPPGGKLSRHSTAFPVRDGRVVYASTSKGLRKEYTVPAFKKAVLAIAAKGPGPFVGDPDPEKVVLVARERLKALEPKNPLLKGMSEVEPGLETAEKEVKSAVLTFGTNAVPPGQNPAHAADDSKPFFYVSVHVVSDFPQAPAGSRKFTWEDETYRAWVVVGGSDPDLVQLVRKTVDEPLLELPWLAPLPEGPGKSPPAAKEADPLDAYPRSDAFSENVAWHKQVGENEIRMSWFLNGRPDIAMVCTADLSKSKVTTSREVYHHASQNEKTRELSHSQVETLRKLAKDLPASAKAPERKNPILVSVSEKGQAKTYLYNRLEPPRDVVRLYDLAGAYLDTEPVLGPRNALVRFRASVGELIRVALSPPVGRAGVFGSSASRGY